MICRKCHAEVDDDLIFCTNCGARLFEPPEAEPTVLMQEPVYTHPDAVKPAKPAKTSSRLKWVALIVALFAIPASIFGIFLLRSQNRQVAVNAATPTRTPATTPTRRANSNQNSNANANSNSNRANANTANTAPNPSVKEEIWNERIEIAPKDHYAVPFEVNDETARITGKVTVLQGEKIDGYVYLKKTYEENFPDENFKMFGFGTSKTTDVRQTLVKENYVLVFVNKTEKPVVIEGEFSLE